MSEDFSDRPTVSWTRALVTRLLTAIRNDPNAAVAVLEPRHKNACQIYKRLCLLVLGDTDWFKWMVKHNYIKRRQDGSGAMTTLWTEMESPVGNKIYSLKREAENIFNRLEVLRLQEPQELRVKTRAELLCQPRQQALADREGKFLRWYFLWIDLQLWLGNKEWKDRFPQIPERLAAAPYLPSSIHGPAASANEQDTLRSITAEDVAILSHRSGIDAAGEGRISDINNTFAHAASSTAARLAASQSGYERKEKRETKRLRLATPLPSSSSRQSAQPDITSSSELPTPAPTPHFRPDTPPPPEGGFPAVAAGVGSLSERVRGPSVERSLPPEPPERARNAATGNRGVSPAPTPYPPVTLPVPTTQSDSRVSEASKMEALFDACDLIREQTRSTHSSRVAVVIGPDAVPPYRQPDMDRMFESRDRIVIQLTNNQVDHATLSRLAAAEKIFAIGCSAKIRSQLCIQLETRVGCSSGEVQLFEPNTGTASG